MDNFLLKKFPGKESCKYFTCKKSVSEFDHLDLIEHSAEIIDDKTREEKISESCNSFEPPKKRICINEDISEYAIMVSPHKWRIITAENLKLKYARIFSKQTSDNILQRLEKEIEYYSGDLLRVRVYGKWHNIPRKQVAYGEAGLSYSFSGTCVPAVSWSKCKVIRDLKEVVESVTGHSFNFVLINRYKDGLDHMGEHRDDEKDLVTEAPIASLSLGQPRDFIFKHKDARGVKAVKKVDLVKLELEHGSLLLMQWPTNRYWYHSLPVRKKAVNVRINLTFRKMVIKK